MTPYELKVQRVEQMCLFELSWGKGQQLTAQLHYPGRLTQLYQEWRRVYLSFYTSALRGRVAEQGSLVSSTVDWHGKLVQAEAALTYEFHRWLLSPELFNIRAQLAKMQDYATSTVDLFLTCSPLDVARLPWEAWEIGKEFASHARMRISRTPPNIRSESLFDRSRSRRKARVLVIMGDETGLNFQAERQAIAALKRKLDIEFVGWQPNKAIAQLQDEIRAALTDEEGWDVLLFAGHSNETELVGGAFAIAPKVSLSIQEIEADLVIAQKRGLKFALFNSCSGLNIAESLIDLGFSQVAVMREPIHNLVAQEFLIQFLQNLADYNDVHDSLLAACDFLNTKHKLTYPSAYLIPSLFRHPTSELFQLKPRGWKTEIARFLPTQKQAIALAGLALLSLPISIQNVLLQNRLLVQSAYRKTTNQLGAKSDPPLLLVQIDEKSIREAIRQGKIGNPKPLNRSYLASIIDKLVALNASVVGVDYLLNRPQVENDIILARSLQKGVARSQPTWFVFAALPDPVEGFLTALPEIANPNWTLQGNIRFFLWINVLAPQKIDKETVLPFAYLLALSHRLQRGQIDDLHRPQVNNSSSFLADLNRSIATETGKDFRSLFSPRSIRLPLTLISYKLEQRWFHPIIDFSIPPDRIYERIPAWKLLSEDASLPQLQQLDRRVVIIAPGGYAEAGISDGSDNFPAPPAIHYWRDPRTPPDLREKFTGAEVHAYMAHHFLTDRLVIPVPDLWVLALAGLLGKGLALLLAECRKSFKRHQYGIISGISIGYGIVSLQIYISAGILLPVLLPIAAVLIITLPFLEKKKLQ
jgi:CHASE2 domain